MNACKCLVTIGVMLLTVLAGAAHHDEGAFLPADGAARVLTVAKEGPAVAGVTVVTEALAIKEAGPKKFRNLQDDDAHDFMLTDPDALVLMKVLLPPLEETSYVFTFHREGIFPFYCTMHQPVMSGQIIVLPPKSRD